MAQLYNQTLDCPALARRTGALSQIGGVRLAALEDGAGRGTRVLDFETGSGLCFTVAVDRAMDITDLRHSGRSLAWHGPSGLRAPGLFEPLGDNGLGWTRGFTGFLATGGLDHIGGPEEVSGETYDYPRRGTVSQPLHGRLTGTPARLLGYGERWEADRCSLWAEGLAVQAALFGEVLHLRRRIEVDLGGTEIRLADTVTNAGFAPTPHMFLYHINLGFPLVDEGTRYLAPIRETLWASHAGALAAQSTPYDRCPAPQDSFSEQVWEHAMAADAEGLVPVAVVNDSLGLGVEIETGAAAFPCAWQWQDFRAGHYVLGVEPATHHVTGNTAARERGEMIWLAPGESRSYQSRFSVLDGAGAIAATEDRITAIAAPPDTGYPRPTGAFPPLHGAAG